MTRRPSARRLERRRARLVRRVLADDPHEHLQPRARESRRRGADGQRARRRGVGAVRRRRVVGPRGVRRVPPGVRGQRDPRTVGADVRRASAAQRAAVRPLPRDNERDSDASGDRAGDFGDDGGLLREARVRARQAGGARSKIAFRRRGRLRERGEASERRVLAAGDDHDRDRVMRAAGGGGDDARGLGA
eukprot:30831-Pelagococcus_subviridis.AAC.2